VSTTPPYIGAVFLAGFVLLMGAVASFKFVLRCPKCGWRFALLDDLSFALDLPYRRRSNCPQCNVGLDHPVP
jgi:hypothetical protein